MIDGLHCLKHPNTTLRPNSALMKVPSLHTNQPMLYIPCITSTAMKREFHQKLWGSWLDGTLDWSLFDFSYDEQNQKWNNCNQEWLFRDPNLFYYPLFGLGDPQSKVAFVATGPAHNLGPPWEGCNNEDSSYRGNIE